jgi:hypothetical protein
MTFKVTGTTVIEDNRDVVNVENVTMNGRVYVGGVLVENANTIPASYTLTGRNSLSTGPITIPTGITVTISTNSRWVIV